MAYVDHAFSISDEDIMMDSSYILNNRPPIKEISLAIALLVFGTLGIIFGTVMAFNRVGGDRAHGMFFAILGGVLFIPGFYYTRIAYYAYKGYKEIRIPSSRGSSSETGDPDEEVGDGGGSAAAVAAAAARGRAITPPLSAMNVPKLKSSTSGMASQGDRPSAVLESLRRRQCFDSDEEN